LSTICAYAAIGTLMGNTRCEVSSWATGKLFRHWKRPSGGANAAPCPIAADNLPADEKPLIKVRQNYLSGVLHFSQAIRFLGAVAFLKSTAQTLDKCVDQLRGPKLEALLERLRALTVEIHIEPV
jgi:hypothetical protein